MGFSKDTHAEWSLPTMAFEVQGQYEGISYYSRIRERMSSFLEISKAS